MIVRVNQGKGRRDRYDLLIAYRLLFKPAATNTLNTLISIRPV
jgi:hypothetical protein